MKQKLLTRMLLVMALLGLGTSAWADAITIDGATAIATQQKNYIKYEFVPANTTYRAAFKAGGNWGKNDGSFGGYNDSRGWYINSTARYISVSLSNALVAGDVITIYASSYTTSTGNAVSIATSAVENFSSGYSVRLSFPTGYNTTDTYKLSYTVTSTDELVGKTALYIGLGSGSTSRFIYVKSINVTTDDATMCAAPNPVTESTKWTFSSYSDAIFTTNQCMDDLYLGADETYQSSIVSSSRTIDGTAYTKALNLVQHDLGNINCDNQASETLKGCILVRLPEGPGKIKIVTYCGTGGYIYYCKATAASTSRTRVTLYSDKTATSEIEYSESDPRVFYVYNGTATNVYIYAIEVLPQVTKSITDAGWATYCSPYALDLENATNLTDAFIVTGGANGVLAKTSVKNGTVPANTGLLLKAPEGTVTIPVVASSETNVSANKLIGKTAEYNLAADGGYVLMNDETYGLAFYKNENDFTVGANTAYLLANFTGSGARSFFSLFNAETTGIEDAVKSKEIKDKIFYNLSGQRVKKATKGLYIVNGKKYVK